MNSNKQETFHQFRSDLYHTVLGRRRDSLMELADALMTSRFSSALAELSLSPLFHRGWNSVYDALGEGQVDQEALTTLLPALLPQESIGSYAQDGTDYPRPQAKTAKDRTFTHSASHSTKGEPVVIGYEYQVLVRTDPTINGDCPCNGTG
jgi:hypothetical protein